MCTLWLVDDSTCLHAENQDSGQTAWMRRVNSFRISKIFERKIVNILFSISLNICFGCSKEPSHWDGSFENYYPQHMFWFRNKKNIFRYALGKVG